MRKFLFGVLALAVVGFAADPRLEQGKVFEKSGKYEEAILEYKAILAENPQSSEAYFAAAEAYVKMKNYSRALANYSLAYKFTPTMSEAYEGAAKVYELLGNKDKAAKERAKDPKNAPAVEEPAEQVAAAEPAKEEAKPVEKAEAPKAEKVPEKAPEPAKAEAKTAKAEPAQAANPSEKQPKTTGFTYDGPAFKKGRELFQAKDYAAAAEVWREVLRQQPGNPGAYYFAGAGRYELGELDKAEYNLKRAFDFPELGYNAHYYLSLIYKKRGDVKAEAKELKEYVKLTTNAQAKSKAEARLAELEGAKAGKAEKAEKLAAPEVKAEPKQEAKAEKQEPKSEAKVEEKAEAEAGKVAAAKEAPQAEPAEPASIERANELFAKGNLSGALAVYKELLETELSDDDRAFVLLQLGNIYRERRDFRLAAARYAEILESYSDSDWASEAEHAKEDAVWQQSNANLLPRNR